MRTTVNLDPDLAVRLKNIAQERGISLREALNLALRKGLAVDSSPRTFHVDSRPMGVRPEVDLTKAMRLASEMEDQAILTKLELRK